MNQYTLTISAFLIAISTAVQSSNHAHEEDHHRQHEAHVHGLAELTLAQEGNELELSLRSPSANIVGFEHKAASAEQIHAVEDAKKVLMSSKQIFQFSGTDCKLEHASVDVSGLIDVDDHADHKGHKDEHHEAHKEDHAHKEEQHEEEHHHDEVHEEHHSEISADYHFECKQADKLRSITVKLLDHFPGIEKLNVQWITDYGQGGTELSKNSAVIQLR